MSIDLPDVRDAVLETARVTVPVLVPWRTDGGSREHNWGLVEDAMWEGWNLVTSAPGPGGPFNRSAALNDAYAWAAPDRELVIVADADSMVPPAQLADAILLAQSTGHMVIAHDRWLNVEEHERERFLATGTLADEEYVARVTPRDRRAVRLMYHRTVSSMLVVPTALWDKVGGFDERFVGWGFEDRAFHRMCTVLGGGYERIHGPVYHLAHDRPAADVNRQRDRGYRANRDLWLEYRRVAAPAELEGVRWPKGRP